MVKRNQPHRSKNWLHLQKNNCVQTSVYTGTLTGCSADKLTHMETIMAVQQPELTGIVRTRSLILSGFFGTKTCRLVRLL